MKADVQYNDYIGTAAADKTDFDCYEVSSYLTQKGVDSQRFEFKGINFYASGDSGYCSFGFICKDNEDGKIKELNFEKKQTLEEFFRLFKRFNVILAPRYEYTEFEGIENGIETIYIDDRD